MSIGRTTWALICLAVLAIVLSLGLWPFHVPPNEVVWLKGRPGLEFGRFSTAIGSDVLKAPDSPDRGGSVELWLQPERIWDSSTLFGFSAQGNPLRLLVRQSLTDLEIQTSNQDRGRAGIVRLYANDVFRMARAVFITVTSSGKGTSVYVDGVLVKATPRFRLSTGHFTGRLVVADARGQTDSWRGRVFGLAIYHRQLEATEVVRHYSTWTQEGRPRTAEDERNVALYLFQERAGSFAHNSARVGSDLQIPRQYTVVDKIFLEPFWQEFEFSRSYLRAAVKNVIGFVPLGFCFYTYFMTLRIKRAAFMTVVLGTAVSITIEALQAYLPTRDSGTTDIFTNTLGTWLGVAVYDLVTPRLPEMIAVLFATPLHQLDRPTEAQRERN
jgi:VanZ like protein/concanavalin A-like lectin/glucanase superfamily protein